MAANVMVRQEGKYQTVPTESYFEIARGRTRSRPSPLSNDNTASIGRPSGELPRAASYTYLGSVSDHRYAKPTTLSALKIAASDLVTHVKEDVVFVTTPGSSGWHTPDDGSALSIAPARHQEIVDKLQVIADNSAQRQPSHSRDDTRSSDASSTVPSRASIESARTTSTTATTPISGQNRQSISASLTRKLNRHSWYRSKAKTPSRSPSPQKIDTPLPAVSVIFEPAPADIPLPETRPSSAGRRKSFLGGRSRRQSVSEKIVKKADLAAAQMQEPVQALTRRRDSVFKRARPISQMFGLSHTGSFDTALPRLEPPPAIPQIPKSFSTDRLPVVQSLPGQSPTIRAAPIPRLLTVESRPKESQSKPRKKDELWSVFRNLDGDYGKFSSKSIALKANVVRSTLLPFLKSYASNTFDLNLRPEDLDRRANILNKWWCGLLEMLYGRNNQSISGTDRPVILDGISGIMERPEWRSSPSPLCPTNQRMKGSFRSYNQSSASLTSNGSDFLAESVHHNVRNIFIQNLSSQMAFVVDKMALRNASASLVAFCGKACAYAFMFVPGMADVLGRLWDTQVDTIRRVLNENGIGKFDKVSSADSDSVLSHFPPALQKLGFISLMKYMRKLRTPPPLPLGTSDIDWWGRWLDRWTGRESDLFYVFVKQYHILLTDFLPAGSSKREQVCAPGLLLVHAQILVNLDATIHRQANSTPTDPQAHTPTFDDVLADPDAHASTLPMAPANAVRIMAENRLIMLIRDFLSERACDHPVARELFAHAFNDLLQASARGTSVYDHSACYTLLDFLEEALVILVRYEQVKESTGTILNSSFWQTVCKKMINSENTMTEIRLYTFLYTIWGTVVMDPQRRMNLCVGLLLDEELFQSRFNHWCPMVRAYYMRLLCWRVGRFDGEEHSEDDVRVYEVLRERLQTTWSYYLYLRETAGAEGCHDPPTNPCPPAPGRRLLIIRSDAITTANSFLSFDAFSMATTTRAPSQKNSWRRSSLASSQTDYDSRPVSPYSSNGSEEPELPTEKGIGSFFRKIIGARPRRKSQGGASQARPSDSDVPPMPNFSKPTQAAHEDRRASIQDIPFRSAGPTSDLVMSPPPPHGNFSFKFSLEFLPSAKAPPPLRLFPPRLPHPAQMLLQTCSGRVGEGQRFVAIQPQGENAVRARYCGRALAEWTLVVLECQSFFDRRRNEGVPNNRQVETPTLGVEVFKRPS